MNSFYRLNKIDICKLFMDRLINNYIRLYLISRQWKRRFDRTVFNISLPLFHFLSIQKLVRGMIKKFVQFFNLQKNYTVLFKIVLIGYNAFVSPFFEAFKILLKRRFWCSGQLLHRFFFIFSTVVKCFLFIVFFFST